MIAVLLSKAPGEWPARAGGVDGPVPPPALSDERLRELIATNFRVVWRALRRFGVPATTLDDAAQQVFATLSARLADVEPGKERAFVLGIAFRVAANMRRAVARRPELALEDGEPLAHPDPNPEELLELKRRRALLDQALDALSHDQRAVFVLFELEGCSMSEIADALSLPMGTVASRLRRGRDRFEAKVRELREQQKGVRT
jgi:RNA polymerase sigma-70 factor (ECF subfamily)